MGKMKKEGAAVAKAMLGPNVDADRLLAKHAAWTAAEGDAASDAGERRQAIGATADEMRLEGKALSWFRALLKIKNEGKRRDALLSLEALLPIARAQIMGNQPDMLEKAAAELEPVAPVTQADIANFAPDDMDEAGPGPDDDWEPDEDDDEIEDEASDFDEAAAALEPASNVVKAFNG